MQQMQRNVMRMRQALPTIMLPAFIKLCYRHLASYATGIYQAMLNWLKENHHGTSKLNL